MRGDYEVGYGRDVTPSVLAEVVLQPVTGMTVGDAGEDLPGRDTVNDAARRLGELGFDIEEAGPATITIRGERELLESTFGDGVPEGLEDVVAEVKMRGAS